MNHLKFLTETIPICRPFYEAKRSYKDNKVAIFLTGVGAYLMAQVIKDEKMDAYILKATVKKWLELNKQPEPLPDTPEEEKPVLQEKDVMFKCIASIRTSINFYDDEKKFPPKTPASYTAKYAISLPILSPNWKGKM